MSEWNHNESFYVDWVLGASMMIDRKLFLSVGMFDENFSYIVKILIYVID